MKKLLAFILSVCICVSSTVMVGAADNETYISELRLVYADSYEKAKKKIADSDFSDYKVFDANLNSGTGETGVWLAYKTTTDIEESITDIAAMYMDGGYHEGNYQAMIEQSRKEYQKMSETYLSAVDYFSEAYEAGDFFAESAYRQLNFYIDSDSGEKLGDLFIGGVDAPALATMFMEGNVYALKNIRALLAQGTAYNESGLTYMETVGEMAALYAEDTECFEDFDNYEEFNDLAILISATVTTFGKMIKEFEAVEADLNYDDEVDTDDELKYIEYQVMANLLKSVTYTDGNTLYDFCKSYTKSGNDFSSLYPLAAALNKGQAAITMLGHFYDVVRYSMSELPESLMTERIDALEETYSEKPFDVYTGVDRSIFNDTYALTTAAYRADAYNESGFKEYISTTADAKLLEAQVASIVGGAPLFVYALYRTYKTYSEEKALQRAADASAALQEKMNRAVESLMQVNAQSIRIDVGFNFNNYDDLVNGLIGKYLPETNLAGMSFVQKVDLLDDYIMKDAESLVPMVERNHQMAYVAMKNDFNTAKRGADITSADVEAADATKIVRHNYFGSVTAAFYLVGGISLLWSSISLGIKVYNYLNPDYGDVPVALVNMIETVDGDRYIKYDAVLESGARDGDKYIPADTNAYEAQRWIALYYTKSYEAGKPLLADFALSKDSQYAKEGSLAVHLFGEGVCYNLNKYNFDSDSDSIYLSVKQSENNKAAVADVPQVVGSMIGGGYLFLAAGMGAIVGAGATIGIGAAKKRKATSPEETSPEEK